MRGCTECVAFVVPKWRWVKQFNACMITQELMGELKKKEKESFVSFQMVC